MALGTAPRRVSPGVWKTRSGKTLTPNQATVWEGYYRAGHTDGRGHFRRTPSVVQQPPKPKSAPRQPTSSQARSTNSTDSAVRGMLTRYANLRIKEQWQSFLGSKANAKLMEIPLFQTLHVFCRISDVYTS
jgi:hypothetical protein